MSTKAPWSTPTLATLDSGSESLFFKRITWKEGIFLVAPDDDEGEPEGPS